MTNSNEVQISIAATDTQRAGHVDSDHDDDDTGDRKRGGARQQQQQQQLKSAADIQRERAIELELSTAPKRLRVC